jgi:hypothetical protein
MINAGDYMILWREGEVSFSYCIMTTCAAQGLQEQNKMFVYPSCVYNKENVQYGC